ncbi:MAG: OadG family protein [Desulforhopalus sp.]|jgi:sodium pump decarboxylase gamma subunit|nr:OadG family protein [Desulforhopalus sp.]
MIFAGVKLMVVGMTTVMLFLGLMILFINLIAWLTRAVTARELETIEKEKAFQAEQRKRAKEAATGDADEDIAVIAAAVAAYEAERFARA